MVCQDIGYNALEMAQAGATVSNLSMSLTRALHRSSMSVPEMRFQMLGGLAYLPRWSEEMAKDSDAMRVRALIHWLKQEFPVYLYRYADRNKAALVPADIKYKSPYELVLAATFWMTTHPTA